MIHLKLSLEPVVMLFSAHVAQLDHALGNGFDGDQGTPADEDAQCGQVAVGSFSSGRTIGIVLNALADAIVVTTATRGMAAIENPHTSARWVALLRFVVTTMNNSLLRPPTVVELEPSRRRAEEV